MSGTGPINVDQIRRILPHRYPMLLVDRVTELVPDVRLSAVKAVTGNEPWYRAMPEHVHARDLGYPPVLLIESWCQAAAVLAAWGNPNPDVVAGQVMLFGGMSNVALHGCVLPGDLVEHDVRLVRTLRDTLFFEGRSRVGERPVLDVGRIVMTMRPAAELRWPAGTTPPDTTRRAR